MRELSSIPRHDAEQWAVLGWVRQWLVAVRAAVLVMTLLSSLMGGLLAALAGPFQTMPLLLCTLGLLMAHAFNNLLNDYVDFSRGLDQDDYYRNRYGTHVQAQGLVSKKWFVATMVCTGLAALLPGAWLVFSGGGQILALMLCGVVFALFYTWPMKQLGLGEPAVWLVWGPFMVGGSYLVSGGSEISEVLAVSLLYGFGPTAVLLAKRLDKLDMDSARNIGTLPVRLGEQRTRRMLAAGLAIQAFLVLLLSLLGYLPIWLLLVAMCLPRLRVLLRHLNEPKPQHRPNDMPESVWPLWFAAHVFDYNRRFTGLFLLGFLLELLLV